MNLLTLYLILKNEEKRILRTLESCAPHIDGNIVVVMDTTSTDRTEEIVREYLKSIKKEFKIYHNKFINYSQQRNFAFSKCRLENTPWVMYADANDQFTDNWDELYGYLELYKKDYKVSSLSTLLNISGTEAWMVGITRNTNKIYYEGEVHEHIKQDGETVQLIECEFTRWQDKEGDTNHRKTEETIKRMEDKINKKREKKIRYDEYLTDTVQLCMEYENEGSNESLEKIIVNYSRLLKYSVQEFGSKNEDFTTGIYPYIQFRLGRAKYLYKNADYKLHLQEALKYTRYRYLEALLYYAMTEYENKNYNVVEELMATLLAYNSDMFLTNIYIWGEKNTLIDKYTKYTYAQKYLDDVYNNIDAPKYVEGEPRKDLNYFFDKIKSCIKDIEDTDVNAKENKQLEGQCV